MLVLRRRVDQRIVIATSDGPVTVQVTKIDGEGVKLGIDAPPRCKVLREELITHTGAKS